MDDLKNLRRSFERFALNMNGALPEYRNGFDKAKGFVPRKPETMARIKARWARRAPK